MSARAWRLAAWIVVAGGVAAALSPVPQAPAPPRWPDPAATRQLVWFDRAGRPSLLPAPPRGYVYSRLAADAATVALDIRDDQPGVWTWSMDDRVLRPLSTGRAGDIAPVWAADRAVLFTRGRGVTPGLFRSPAGPPAAGAERLRFDAPTLPMLTSAHPDGRHLLATVVAASGFDIVALDLETAAVRPLVTSSADDLNGEVSPDGRWVAYQSRRSGQFEIWLRRWSTSLDDGWRITSGGGTRPVWTRGGRELVYLTHDGEVRSIETAANPALPHGLSFGAPRRLFAADVYREPVGRTFDVSADGDHLLAIVEHAAALAPSTPAFTKLNLTPHGRPVS